MRKTGILTVGAVVLMFYGTVAMAGEGRKGGGGGAGQGQRRERARERFKQSLPEDIQALLAKFANGEELTAEEKAKLKEFREGVRERIEKWREDHPGIALRQAIRERICRRMPGDIKALVAKYRKGEQLTEEEQARLREFRDKLCERLKQLLAD